MRAYLQISIKLVIDISIRLFNAVHPPIKLAIYSSIRLFNAVNLPIKRTLDLEISITLAIDNPIKLVTLEEERARRLANRKEIKATCLELAASSAGGDDESEILFRKHAAQLIRDTGQELDDGSQ